MFLSYSDIILLKIAAGLASQLSLPIKKEHDESNLDVNSFLSLATIGISIPKFCSSFRILTGISERPIVQKNLFSLSKGSLHSRISILLNYYH